MTFDDELKHAFEALTARLQTELERQIQAAKDELAAAAPPPPAPPPPKEGEPPPSAPDAEADERLVEGIRSIDNARSLSAILDALASAAARDASRVAVLLTRGGEWRAWRTTGFDHEPDVAALSGMAPDAGHDSRGRVRLPLAISGETVGVLYAEDGRLAALEILARHAARCLESMTAFKTARALARQDPPPGDETGTDDEMSARRYARLLVSEIKLYHEAEVVVGRRERDLMSRLAGEITRARVLYDQRVPSQVRRRADYFHDELVRTLAEGDASLVETRKYEVESTK
jgi:hypothetical protein